MSKIHATYGGVDKMSCLTKVKDASTDVYHFVFVCDWANRSREHVR